MKNFTADMSATEKEKARTIFSYEIAKLICEKVSNYREMIEILEGVKRQFDMARDLAELKLDDAPRDKWYMKIEVPETTVPGTSEK